MEAFARGGLSLSLFAPRKHDYQNPHGQDELYLIVSGHGEFQFEQQQTPFSAGDVIFVAADRPHRFVKFSEDFVAWVVFWGPPREQP